MADECIALHESAGRERVWSHTGVRCTRQCSRSHGGYGSCATAILLSLSLWKRLRHASVYADGEFKFQCKQGDGGLGGQCTADVEWRERESVYGHGWVEWCEGGERERGSGSAECGWDFHADVQWGIGECGALGGGIGDAGAKCIFAAERISAGAADGRGRVGSGEAGAESTGFRGGAEGADCGGGVQRHGRECGVEGVGVVGQAFVYDGGGGPEGRGRERRG